MWLYSLNKLRAVSDSRFLSQTTVNLHGRLFALRCLELACYCLRSPFTVSFLCYSCCLYSVIISEWIINTTTLRLNSVSLFLVNDNQDLIKSQPSNMILHQSFLLLSPSVFDVYWTYFLCVCFKHLRSVTHNSNWLPLFSCQNIERIVN